jgi:hypothetical protein
VKTHHNKRRNQNNFFPLFSSNLAMAKKQVKKKKIRNCWFISA